MPKTGKTTKTATALSSLAVLASAVTLSAFAATPAHATTPGDANALLAFAPGPGNTGVSHQTIDTVAPDGTTHEWQAAGTRAGSTDYISGLAYSPDGSKIAYIVDIVDLWVANADGTDAHRAVSINGNDAGVGWSPDGRYIYFGHSSLNATAPVVDRVQPNGVGLETLFTVPGGKMYDGLSVSPAGDIAFTAASGGTTVIDVWHHDTGTIVPTGQVGWHPDFSPDGRSLAYIAYQSPTGDNLFIAGSDGSNPKLVVAGNMDGVDWPVWSPDGSGIAYATSTAIREYFPSTTSTRTISTVSDARQLTWQPHAYASRPELPRTVDRIGGADRIDTAVAASRFEFSGAGTTGASARTAKVAVLSRSDTFADALGGSALAAEKVGPLLLTSPAALDDRVRAELRRVLPQGSTVYLLGGVGALSPAVEQAVRDAGFTPHRVSGSDRYETSLAIAREVTLRPSTVLVATGNDFPDALGAGAFAGARSDAVVVLSDDKVLTPDVRSYVADALNDPAKPLLVSVGGQATQAMWGAFGSLLNPLAPTRYFPASGIDRYATASQLSTLSGASRTVALATGSGWADALAGGTVAGLNGASLVLVNGTNTGQAGMLNSNGGLVHEILAFGGQGVLPDASVAAYVALTGTSAWTWADNRQAPTLP